MSRRIDPDLVPEKIGCGYPAPFDEPCQGRARRVLGNLAGLTAFGVNQTRLPPGAWSAQRHWHSHEDEFVYVLEGELVLVTDAGEELLRAGDCAGFPAGERDGHHLQNRSDADAVFLEVGARRQEDHGEYSDIDLAFKAGRYPGGGGGGYSRKDGSPR